MTISFAESALRDLEDVRSWYTEQGVPDVGARLVSEVFQRVQALTDHPDLGRVVPEFEQSFLRELIHPPFRIVYRRPAAGEDRARVAHRAVGTSSYG
jgi:toxin ParE1/3/4